MPFPPSRSVSFLTKSALLALTTSALIATAGCGMGTIASGSDQPISGGAISGYAHGGRQAITSANVFVMAAGDVGYGSAAKILAETTTDATTGYFSFPLGSYTCPAPNTTPYSDTLYLVVAGGNPGVNSGSTTTNNTASVLLAVLGDCTNVLNTEPSVGVSEVSTFAGVTALQQFFNPTYNAALSSSTPPAVGTAVSTENFGTSSGNINGLVNAAAGVTNLVGLGTGLPAGAQTLTGSLSGVTITATPETSKLYAAANSLATCVNSSGPGSTPCTSLFTDTGAPSGSDVLMTSYYMANTANTLNASSSAVATTCGLSSGFAPYGTSTCPTDWTVGVNFNTTSTISSVGVFTSPEYVAVDSNGNIWVANYNAAAGILELSSNGAPIKDVLQTGSASGIPTGGTGGWLTIDPSNDVYVATYATPNTTVAEYDSSGTAHNYTVGTTPDQMASDGSGNIFVFAAGSTALWEITSGGTPSAITGTLAGGSGSGVAVDANYNVYVSGASTSKNYITPYIYSSGSYTIQSTTTKSALYSPYGLAFDNSGYLWTINDYGTTTTAADDSVVKMTVSSTTGTISAATAYSGSGIKYGQHIVIDGGGNVWGADETAGGGITETSSTGTALSPSGGTGVAPFGFVHTVTPFQIAADGSGNIWAGNYTNTGIEEIVGAAVPVVTPIAKGLPKYAGGVSQLGSRPLAGLNLTPVATESASDGIPHLILTPDGTNPVALTNSTLTATYNGTVVCTTTVTIPANSVTPITCTGTANALAVGTYTLNGSLTGDNVEYGNSGGQFSLIVTP